MSSNMRSVPDLKTCIDKDESSARDVCSLS